MWKGLRESKDDMYHPLGLKRPGRGHIGEAREENCTERSI
jgi:hypothetical protein